MEVILLEKIRNLGPLGARVKVKPGYGRNFLVPTGKAVYATADNLAKFEALRAELEKRAAENVRQAEERKQALLALGNLVMKARAGEEGKLFGSIGTRDIADRITAAGVAVQKSEVFLPAGLLRETGEHEVHVQFHSDVTAVITLSVTGEA